MTGVLCAVLLLWQPLAFASEAATTLPSLGMRGLPALLELIVHGAVAAISVAAASALWNARPHGPALAAVALACAAAADVQRLYWSILPSQTKPGDELPLALLTVVHSAAWLMFLRWKARRHLRSSPDPPLPGGPE